MRLIAPAVYNKEKKTSENYPEERQLVFCTNHAEARVLFMPFFSI